MRWRRGSPVGAGGSPRRLLALVFAAAAAVTAVLGLDATVVLLTPAAFAAARRARLDARPSLYACTHLANTRFGAPAGLQPHEPAGVPG